MDPPSTVFWHRTGPQWSIDLHESQSRKGDERLWVFVTGRFEGLWRSRYMSSALYLQLVEAVRRLCGAVAEQADHLIDDASDIPPMPKCRPIASVEIGPCRIEMVAHRDDGRVVLTLAAYDSDDDRAPVFSVSGGDIALLVAGLEEGRRALTKHARRHSDRSGRN